MPRFVICGWLVEREGAFAGAVERALTVLGKRGRGRRPQQRELLVRGRMKILNFAWWYFDGDYFCLMEGYVNQACCVCADGYTRATLKSNAGSERFRRISRWAPQAKGWLACRC